MLKRLDFNRLTDRETAKPRWRYQRDRPCELICIYNKLDESNRLGHRIICDGTGQNIHRGAGWPQGRRCCNPLTPEKVRR